MDADLLNSVLGAAAEALDPEPPTKVVVPGAEVAWDDACGQLWVRVVSAAPRFQRGTSCPIALVYTLGIGVIRCVATVNDDGVPPSAAQVTADGNQMAADVHALYGALACLLPTGAARASLTTWTPLGPSGGSAGGEWQMEVWLT